MILEVQHGQPQTFYRGNNHVNVIRTLNNNRTSPSNYESSTRIDRNGRCREMVSSSSSKSPRNTSWWNDRDLKRKRRVANYKAYSAESKLKCSLKKGFRSLKIRCLNIVYNL